MNNKFMELVHFEDLGNVEYAKAWDYQEIIFNETLLNKKNNTGNGGTFLMCEHPHVFTLGKSGKEQNFLIEKDFLKKINATYFKTNRGGDITYHGPGQIVGYPILDLEKIGVSLKDYIYNIEETIIKTIANYGLKGEHDDNATGVWLKGDKVSRKICAIGVKASRFVTMHGFAFNVKTDLNYFNYINPCGFTDRGVTSLEQEVKEEMNMEEVKEIILENFSSVFGVNLIK